MQIPTSDLPRVVIIGGGFAGIQIAKRLDASKYQVVLIDKNNYHTFQPLLYQVATAGLEADSIAYPIRKVFKKKKGVFFRMAEVRSISPEKQQIQTNIGELSYDYLVMATGATTNFFGNEKIEELSMSMKSVSEALDMRSLILQNYEEALLTTDPEERKALLNYVIVGAGPTGVELAGALAELKKHVLPRDYPELDLDQMNIYLVEASSEVLSAMSDKSSEHAEDYLEKIGIEIWKDTFVQDYDGKVVRTSREEPLHAKTLIWAAGVKGNPVNGLDGYAIQKSGRVAVDEFLRVKGYQRVFAIGDVAQMETEDYPNGHPMLGPAAVQQGQHLAKNLNLDQDDWNPFTYFDKGSMATIGRNLAVMDIKKFHFKGFFAWLSWAVVHLALLVGYRNKLVALVNWWWSYINYDRGVRLIIRPFSRKRIQKHKKVEVF